MKTIDYKGLAQVPAPWDLKGDGFIFIYRIGDRFYEKEVHPFPFQSQRILKIGALFLVRYSESPVGPYDEILFTSGMYKCESVKRFSINNILVSTQESVINGVNNWGIPKQEANFRIKKSSSRSEWSIHNSKSKIDISVNSGGLHFPMSTSLLPLKLVQELDESLILTTAHAKGKAQLAKIEHFSSQGAFPDLGKLKPWLGVAVKDFSMQFLKPHKI